MEYTTFASSFIAFCLTGMLFMWVMGQDDWWKW